MNASGYADASREPLQILAFLLPGVIAYELGLAWSLQAGDNAITIKAHNWLLEFFQTFDITTFGLSLPGIAVVVVLLIWHLLAHKPWRVRPGYLGLMLLESFALTLPLFVLAMLVSGAAAATSTLAASGADLGAMGTTDRLIVSIGAGIYEELIFRMLIILLIHTLLSDVAGASSSLATAIAIVVSAGLFAAYHDLTDATGEVAVTRLVFYSLAGLYFAGVYVTRGFGIAVATHIIYDCVTATMISAGGQS